MYSIYSLNNFPLLLFFSQVPFDCLKKKKKEKLSIKSINLLSIQNYFWKQCVRQIEILFWKSPHLWKLFVRAVLNNLPTSVVSQGKKFSTTIWTKALIFAIRFLLQQEIYLLYIYFFFHIYFLVLLMFWYQYLHKRVNK